MQVEAEFLIVAVGERALTSRRNGCIPDQLAQLVVLVAELVVGQKEKKNCDFTGALKTT